MSSAASFVRARDFLLHHRDDYERAVAGFNWPDLEQFNWALDYFDVAPPRQALALWLLDEAGVETKLTFGELTERSNRVANFLRIRGVRRGDRILVMLSNEVALWEVMLAAMKLGAVVIPATVLLTAADIADRVARGEVKHIVAAAQEAGKFGELAPGPTRIAVGGEAQGWVRFEEAYRESGQFTPDGITQASDPLLLYFTSGTTARPKLVLHSHASYPVGHLSTMYWLGLRPGDIHWNISSPGWAKHAWSSFFAPWNAAATVFVFNYGRFVPKTILELLRRCGITSLCAPPTVWRLLIQEPLKDYAVSLRELTSAGEPLNPEVIEQVRAAWGITIRDGYGQTETTAQIGNPPGQRLKEGSMGRPLPGYRVVLLDPDDRAAEEGEISLALDAHPLGLMVGYADDAQRSRSAVGGRYYRTGDIASRDPDGYITYVGRSDDVFKSSDYRVSPFELESVLIEHPAIAEAAVVPSPDSLRLAVPKAYVACRGGHRPDRALALSVLAFSRARLAPYKRIRRLEFYELPKTISGKIRRVELRKREEARAPGTRNANEYWIEDFEELRSARTE